MVSFVFCSVEKVKLIEAGSTIDARFHDYDDKLTVEITHPRHRQVISVAEVVVNCEIFNLRESAKSAFKLPQGNAVDCCPETC